MRCCTAKSNTGVQHTFSNTCKFSNRDALETMDFTMPVTFSRVSDLAARVISVSALNEIPHTHLSLALRKQANRRATAHRTIFARTGKSSESSYGNGNSTLTARGILSCPRNST
jgi:hypothetical protein